MIEARFERILKTIEKKYGTTQENRFNFVMPTDEEIRDEVVKYGNECLQNGTIVIKEGRLEVTNG
jgi:hypothetical protein